MRFIRRTDIENWARDSGSKTEFAIILSRLIRASTPKSTFIEFPSGSASFVGGWDGKVISNENCGYVPDGISLWEIGTESGITGKFNGDYNKRTKDTLGYEINKCTLIFITPRFWKQKNAWVQEKNNEKKWLQVIAYDSRNLEEWFELSPVVSRIFANYIGKCPFDGIQIAQDFWDEWSECEKTKLVPEIVTAGRSAEIETLKYFLNGPSSFIGIKASTKSESIAFVISCALQFEQTEKEYFFSRCLIVNSIANFRTITGNFKEQLILIADFHETQPLLNATKSNHIVIVPLGAGEDLHPDPIVLPTPDPREQETALTKMGFPVEDAKKYSREAGRNVTLLKKLLNAPYKVVLDVNNQNYREIIPAILLGKWDEDSEGDRELLEKLSGMGFDTYYGVLSRWKNINQPILTQIGKNWRLISPLDAWSDFSSFILPLDFNKLKECFLYAFKNGNPLVNNDVKNFEFQPIINPKSTFSGWTREGLIQSLILISLHGNRIKITNLESPKNWVNLVIANLFANADGKLWISLNHEMPLIAEASPESLIYALFDSLSKDEKPVLDMFTEQESFIFPVNNHTGLLWALEGLAWLPEYFEDACVILAKLSALDPGVKIENKPINSLIEILKPWHYQTLASFEARKNVLKKISSTENEIGWMLLIKLLPTHHQIAENTHKMRWRMFDYPAFDNYTWQEIFETHSYIVDLLISVFDFSEQELSDLIDISPNLNKLDRDKVFSFMENIYHKVIQKEYKSWHTLRKLLFLVRSYNRVHPSLSINDMKRYDSLYRGLCPTDVIQKFKWLFDEFWPEFPEGFRDDDIEKTDKWNRIQNEYIHNQRKEALSLIYKEFGIEKIKELCISVNEPGILGETSAYISLELDEQFILAQHLNSNDKKELAFIHGFIFKNYIINGFPWVISFFEILKKAGFSEKALARIFISINPDKEVWEFLDSVSEAIKKEYWHGASHRFYHLTTNEKIKGINELLSVKRYYSALNVASHFIKEVPTNLIISIMQKFVNEKSEEEVDIKGYEYNKLFRELYERVDVEKETLAHLEWDFLPLMSYNGTFRYPKILHEELVSNPQFFVDILKLAYLPKNIQLFEVETEGIPKNVVMIKRRYAKKLLDTCDILPGQNAQGQIGYEKINLWVNKVREFAEDAGRLEVADAIIGKMLASNSKKAEWPSDIICGIIERINTETMKRGFSTEIYNQRGSTVRLPLEGGEIEKSHALFFQRLAEKFLSQYPHVSRIFKNLAENYCNEAKYMDDEAEKIRYEY